MDNQKEITLSSNPAYSAVYRDSQQPVLQDKPIYLAADRSVVSLDMIGKRLINNLLFVLIFRIGSTSEPADDEDHYYSRVSMSWLKSEHWYIGKDVMPLSQYIDTDFK